MHGRIRGKLYTDGYPSCSNTKANYSRFCEPACVDKSDPCYSEDNKNLTGASWHVSKRSDDLDFEHMRFTVGELTIASEVEDEREMLEISFQGEDAQDTMKFDISWNVNRSKIISFKTNNERPLFEMSIPKQKIYGFTIG